MTALAEAGAALMGGTLEGVTALHGGDLSQVVRIVLGDGRAAIVKNGPNPRAEAVMLRVIAATGAPVPCVFGANDEALVLECVADDGRVHDAWRDLGESLAKLHRARGLRYGWHEDYAFGPLPIVNGWADDWPAFWAERRLLVHLAHVPRNTARRIEELARDLANRLPARPAPALLHGDMWPGNVLVSGTRVSALIDPACYYGHAEVDLAMLNLFDSPEPEFYAAYGPLEAGFAERLAIYKLWPALVHLRLFGGGYLSMVDGFLSASGI
jgi:fructosamine-3-kinase